MKTQEQKLQHVMEAAGECNHAGSTYGEDCKKCGRNTINDIKPDDLNELFRLARRATDCGSIGFTIEGDISDTAVICWLACDGEDYDELGNSEAEALLNALFIATGGVE